MSTSKLSTLSNTQPPSIVGLLSERRFLPLFITQFLSAFNDNAFKNALLFWLTYNYAKRIDVPLDAFLYLASLLFILPFFLFSATAGQLSDKYPKCLLVRKIKGIEVLFMLLIGLFFYLDSLWGLLAVLFLMGLQSTFFGPIKYSLLPEQLPQSALILANGLVEGSTFLAILLGTIFGGIIINQAQGQAIISVSVLGLAMISYLSSCFIPKTQAKDAQLKVSFNLYRETSQVLKMAHRNHPVWLAILAISWFWLMGALFLTQFPSYTDRVIGGEPIVVTLFLTLFSIGIALGSLFCNYLLRGEVSLRFNLFSTLAMSICIIIFCLCSQFYPPTSEKLSLIAFLRHSPLSSGIIASLLLFSFFAGLYIVPHYAAMQAFSEPKAVARMIASNNIINSVFVVGSSLLGLLALALGWSFFSLLYLIALLNFLWAFAFKHWTDQTQQSHNKGLQH